MHIEEKDFHLCVQHLKAVLIDVEMPKADRKKVIMHLSSLFYRERFGRYHLDPYILRLILSEDYSIYCLKTSI